LIEPLRILETKWNNTKAPPSLLVLVQWHGLPQEETTWEAWDTLNATFHLEDKVPFPDGGIDADHQLRPKRNTHRPSFWKDYVIP